jgi:membrane-bound inhibitor of C-type lysozyme
MTIYSKSVTTLFIISCFICAPIFAQNDNPSMNNKKITKKINSPIKTKVATTKTIESKVNNINDSYSELENEPDTKLSSALEYKCELGNTLTLYTQNNNDQIVDMKWKNHLYRLNRVSTSTGAHRYENEKAGLVWINIPAKGLLLDSIKGRQLANECKTNQISLVS